MHKKNKLSLPLLDGVNDLVTLLLIIIICHFQRLLHGSGDLPHLSVKVDIPLLLSKLRLQQQRQQQQRHFESL